MLYNYREALEIYGTDYKLKQALSQRKIYRIESGIYSDGKDNFTKYELVLKKYPSAFLVKNSALHHIGFIESEPDVIHLGTARNALRIHDKRVKQHFYTGMEKAEAKSRLIRTYVTGSKNEIRLLNLSGLFLDLLKDRNTFQREDLFSLLARLLNCEYFADDDIDEMKLLEKVLDDRELFNLIEDICDQAQRRKWHQDFEKELDAILAESAD